jgi:hypothetical protein
MSGLKAAKLTILLIMTALVAAAPSPNLNAEVLKVRCVGAHDCTDPSSPACVCLCPLSLAVDKHAATDLNLCSSAIEL